MKVRDAINKLGEPVDHAPPPYHLADLMVVILAALCIVGIVSGIFAGGPP